MTDRGQGNGAPYRPAVIDIGSNSVRLVIYEGPRRAPVEVLNEKSLCGLGDREPETGRLREDAIAEALHTLRGFRRILDAARPTELHVFATAASREAPNGPEFLGEVRRIGLSPELLTGDREAYFAALGILSGAPEVGRSDEGAIAGDIGGGSLELSHIQRDADDHIAERVSLPLGGLALHSRFGNDLDASTDFIRSTLKGVGWLADCPAKRLLVVGGAWRALARIAIKERHYPVDTLDRFTMPVPELLRFCRDVAVRSPDALLDAPAASRRRAPTLPHAAIVLREILKMTRVERFEVSSSGVREGVLFARLPQAVRADDPLLELCAYFGRLLSPSITPAAADLLHHLTGLVEEDHRLTRWLHAACHLANIGKSLYPAHPTSYAGDTIMGLPLHGIGHEGRIFIAAVISARYGARPEAIAQNLPVELIGRQRLAAAVTAGLILRVLLKLAPAGGPILREGRLTVSEDGEARFVPFSPGETGLVTLPEKRLARLTDWLQRQAGEDDQSVFAF